MPTAQSPAPPCSWLRVRIPLVWLYGETLHLADDNISRWLYPEPRGRRVESAKAEKAEEPRRIRRRYGEKESIYPIRSRQCSVATAVPAKAIKWPIQVKLNAVETPPGCVSRSTRQGCESHRASWADADQSLCLVDWSNAPQRHPRRADEAS